MRRDNYGVVPRFAYSPFCAIVTGSPNMAVGAVRLMMDTESRAMSECASKQLSAIFILGSCAKAAKLKKGTRHSRNPDQR